LEASIELPTIDYGRLNGRRHHIAYGLSISREPTATFYNQLVRFDLEREETKVWYEDLHYPSEPIFLHDPNSHCSTPSRSTSERAGGCRTKYRLGFTAPSSPTALRCRFHYRNN
jgi:hypothetical protein